ncbi:MAG TPA: DUF397 domain-containing protein [Streptosporangiaceae bacterium]|jgi:hypothetical protein|nr:DUF397 domain-containing protein [Streptosporangiaceae bacterium]
MNVINIPVSAWRKSRHSNGEGNCVEVATWRKSSHSNGQAECVEVATWRKSRYSNGQGACVEVATRPEGPRVAVRDSKDPAGPMLTITPAAWHTFTTKIKAGRLG